MKLKNTRFPRALGALTATILAFGLAVPAAEASAGASVSATPSAVMPYITSADSNVAQLVQCGSTMYAVGAFTQVGRPGGLRYARRNAFSFNAVTGAVSAWNPSPSGRVESVAVSSDCATVYLAGAFVTVGGTSSSPNLAKVNSTSGVADTAFRPAANKEVDTVLVQGGRLLVGGLFTSIGGASRQKMASLSLTTGAASTYLTMPVAGRIPGNSGATRIFKFRLSPTGTRVLAMGNFATIGGQARSQIFMMDLGASAATLDAWYSPTLAKPCDETTEPYYVRAATWSPDSSRVYLATTGFKGLSPLCDAAVAFSSASSSTLNPIWINKTGCDSLYAVAADATTVYIAGHERYIDNPAACDTLGPGASDRPGVGAISPTTGHSVAWNPTRSRGHGADDLLRTSAGLWIASDTYLNSTSCGLKYHPGICFFPNG